MISNDNSLLKKNSCLTIFLFFFISVLFYIARVLNSDKESYDIWKNVIGLPEDQIIPSTEEDNFWSMGDGEGPCGPCSEIFWDTRDMNVSDDER
jgi:alanyl-tRNA synthetase